MAIDEREGESVTARTIRLIMEQGVAQERERCAKIAESRFRGGEWNSHFRNAGEAIAFAIRNDHDQ